MRRTLDNLTRDNFGVHQDVIASRGQVSWIVQPNNMVWIPLKHFVSVRHHSSHEANFNRSIIGIGFDKPHPGQGLLADQSALEFRNLKSGYP